VARLKEGGLTGQTDRWSRGKGERLGMLYSPFTENGIVLKELSNRWYVGPPNPKKRTENLSPNMLILHEHHVRVYVYGFL
jgi:hypothetical protein